MIAESLHPGAVLEGLDLRVTKIVRAEVGNVEVGQPLLWTLLEFTVSDDDVERLAETLQEQLSPIGGWYCDFRNDEETHVVFHHRRGDDTAREEAKNYGRTVGVPEPQLDWPV